MYFGNYVENELDRVGEKRNAKQERKNEARQRKLNQLLDPTPEVVKKGQYFDPAFFFQQ